MSKFNQKVKTGPNAVTYEGGKAYEKNSLEEWMNMLFSSYLEDGYYENADVQGARYIELVQEIGEQYGWEFVAKAAHFSRNELGLRSISQLTAAMLNDKSFPHKRNFFSYFFHRPDDVSEVFAAIDAVKGKRSHALVRGAADYLSTLGEYQLGKYKMNGKTYNMYDLINITHATSPAINLYKNDMLAAPDTWEVKVSAAESQEERDQEWKRLVEEKKLGYLALIRNLRNILSADCIDRNWVSEHLVPQIIDENKIKKSLVLPYQIYCAYKNIGVQNSQVINALDDAFVTAAASNMPKLEGRSAIFLDVSGSMDDAISAHSNMSIKEVGAVYAVALSFGQKNRPTIVKFGTKAKKFTFGYMVSPFRVIEELEDNADLGYGTQIDTAFEVLSREKFAADRIFMISDMQIMDSKSRWYWYDNFTGPQCFDDYAKRFNSNCKCYSFDLGNYRTQCANPKNPNVHLLTALNDKVFEMLKYVEDGGELYNYVNSLRYY